MVKIMKRLIIILLMLVSFTSISQEPLRDQLEDNWKSYLEDGWYRLSLGVFSHAIGFNTLQYGDLSNPPVLQGFIIANTLGLTLDVMSIHSFVKARQTRNKIKTLERTPRFY